MTRIVKWFIIGCVAVAVLWYAVLWLKGSVQPKLLYLQNRNFPVQTGLYDLYKTEHAEVVMLGNSLTQWVEWNELLGRTNIANRGIAGDITDGYLRRMEYVYRLRPKICFIEGGINDLYANVPLSVVFENYVKIVEDLRAHDIIPIIQSTLFVSPKWHDADEKNKDVVQLNVLLEEFARKNAFEFINLNARMSLDSFLRDELTYDGVHLTAAGYKIWGEEVEKILLRHHL